SAAMAAATMNNEHKRRRKRGRVKARFDVIELFLYWLYMRRPAIAGRRVDREVVWLFPLRSEIHRHSVGAGLGSSFTHLIHEASLTAGAGVVVIQTVIRRCRDHISIAVDVHVGRGREPPFETRCIYVVHLFPLALEHELSANHVAPLSVDLRDHIR